MSLQYLLSKQFLKEDSNNSLVFLIKLIILEINNVVKTVITLKFFYLYYSKWKYPSVTKRQG